MCCSIAQLITISRLSDTKKFLILEQLCLCPRRQHELWSSERNRLRSPNEISSFCGCCCCCREDRDRVQVSWFRFLSWIQPSVAAGSSDVSEACPNVFSSTSSWLILSLFVRGRRRRDWAHVCVYVCALRTIVRGWDRWIAWTIPMTLWRLPVGNKSSRSSSFVWFRFWRVSQKFFMAMINCRGEVTNRLNKCNLQYCFDFDVNFWVFSVRPEYVALLRNQNRDI